MSHYNTRSQSTDSTDLIAQGTQSYSRTRMQQPSSIQREEQGRGRGRAPVEEERLSTVYENVFDRNRPDGLRPQPNGDSLGGGAMGYNPTDDTSLPQGGAGNMSKYNMPDFNYIDNSLEENWREGLTINQTRAETFDDVCPKGRLINNETLARMIWETKRDVRNDLGQMQDAMWNWQIKAVSRIKMVESNQQKMCSVIQDIEISQTNASDTVEDTRQDFESMKTEQNKMITVIEGLKEQVGRLTRESNIHQRNFNDYNLRIFNLKAPIQGVTSRTGRENTVDLVADLLITNKLLPAHCVSIDQAKEQILAAFRVGLPKDDKPRCVLVKFANIRTRDTVFHRAIEYQKELRRLAKGGTPEEKENFKKSVFIAEDMTPLDMRERELLKPLVEKMRTKDKGAYYTKGKIIISKEGRVNPRVVNEFMSAAQLRPVHMPPDIPLRWLEMNKDRPRNYSAPGGAINYTYNKPEGQDGSMLNRYAPLFPEYVSFPVMKPKHRGRGRANNSGSREESRPGNRR